MAATNRTAMIRNVEVNEPERSCSQPASAGPPAREPIITICTTPMMLPNAFMPNAS